MIKKGIAVVQQVIHYYNKKQIPVASAALCYYLTMSVFPMIICLYTLLGYNYDLALRILGFVENFMSADTVDIIRGFLTYVEQNHSTAMFYAGIMLLLTSASAAVRCINITIGRMQGEKRYGGVMGYLLSMILAVAFLAVIWFAIVVMLTSKDLMLLLNEKLPFVDISGTWQWIKYLLLGGILFLTLWGMYRIDRRKNTPYLTWPGALIATLGMLGMSLIFSVFIAASAKYSLVYGSLASMILLMLWLFFSCQVIFVGAAFNISLWDLSGQESES